MNPTNVDLAKCSTRNEKKISKVFFVSYNDPNVFTKLVEMFLIKTLPPSQITGTLPSQFAIQFGSTARILGMTYIEISVVYNLYYLMYQLMMFFSGPLCVLFGPRKVCFVASLVNALCYIALIKVNSTLYMLIVFGFIFGTLIWQFLLRNKNI